MVDKSQKSPDFWRPFYFLLFNIGVFPTIVNIIKATEGF